MAKNGGTSPWVYVAVGCGAIVVLGLIGFGSCVYFGARWAQDMAALETDPQARNEKAMEILHSREIPEGYYAAASFSIPLVGDVVVLNDRPPDDDGRGHGVDEKGFFYINFRQMGDQQELKDFFQGDGRSLSAFGQIRADEIRIDSHDMDIVRRGSMEMDGYRFDFVVIRGGIEFRGQDFRSLSSLSWIHCPDENRLRVAGWLGRDPDPDVDSEDLDYAGTPGDEQALRNFMGKFAFCSAD